MNWPAFWRGFNDGLALAPLWRWAADLLALLELHGKRAKRRK